MSPVRSAVAAHTDEGLERALERSVFSDDSDAVQQLEARIAAAEAVSGRRKAINSAFRRAPGADRTAKLAALLASGQISSEEALAIAHHFEICHWEDRPFPTYSLSNLRTAIARDRRRLEEVRTRSQCTEAADRDGLHVERLPDGRCRVTFAQKPNREVLGALRAAGYRWGQGSWTGPAEKLPAGLDC